MRIVHELQASGPWTERGGELASPPLRRRPARGAAVWCRDWVVEAFAAYAHAMYPSFAEADDEVAWRDQRLEELLRHPSVAIGESTVPWLYALDPWTPEEPFEPYRKPEKLGWFTRLRAAVTRFREWLRREFLARRTAAGLSVLDDHSLKDIGLHRSQIESIARHGDPLRF
jgi:uncharacterized protein YjiS (DUF1127 family)